MRLPILLLLLCAGPAVFALATPPAAGETRVNLVPNGGFEVDSDYDGIPDGWSTAPRVVHVPLLPSARTGEGALFLADRPLGSPSVSAVSERFPIPPGATLTFSAWYRTAPTGLDVARIELRCYSPSHGSRGFHFGESGEEQRAARGEWRKHQLTWVPESWRKDDSCRITLSLGGALAVPGAGAVDGAGAAVWDDVALVVGTAPLT